MAQFRIGAVLAITLIGTALQANAQEQKKLDQKPAAKAASQTVEPAPTPVLTPATVPGSPMTPAQASWVDRVKVSGDMRGRLHYEKANKSTTGDTENFKARLRARLAVSGKVTDQVSLNFRISTGSTSPQANNRFPNSDFTTFGSTKLFDLNLGYIDYRPFKELTVQYGKHPNPFWRAGFSPMNYFYDQTFEGLVAKYSTEWGSFKPFASIGWTNWLDRQDSPGTAAPSTTNGPDVGMYSAQIGTKFTANPFEVTAAVAYYHHYGMKGLLVSAVGGATTATPPVAINPGNSAETNAAGQTVFSYDYQIINPGIEVVFTGMSLPLTFYVDNSINAGADRKNIATLVGFNVGRVTTPGTWTAGLSYRDVGLDAVVAQIADAGFAGGPTDNKGYELSLGYGVAQNISLSFYYDRAKAAISSIDYDAELFLLDLNASF